MTGIAPTIQGYTIQKALLDAITAALAVDPLPVDICDGFRWPIQAPDAVAVTSVKSAITPGPMGPQRSRDETITLEVNIVSWRIGNDNAAEREAKDRAFGLLTAIEKHIRETDITLGGTCLWCVLGEYSSDGETTEDDAGYGRLIAIDAFFEARARTQR